MAQVDYHGDNQPGLRQRKKAEKRIRLIECASRLIEQRGYEAASLTEITEAADVSARTFYHYFDSKADIALAGFHAWLSDLLAAMEARPEGEAQDQMLLAALQAVTADRSARPVIQALVLAKQNPDVAGRVFGALVDVGDQLSRLFGRRFGYPVGSAERRYGGRGGGGIGLHAMGRQRPGGRRPRLQVDRSVDGERLRPIRGRAGLRYGKAIPSIHRS